MKAARYGASVAKGLRVAPGQPDHFKVISGLLPEERERIEAAGVDTSAPIDFSRFCSPERNIELGVVRVLAYLHIADLEGIDAPVSGMLAGNQLYVVAVRDEHAVGYLIAADGDSESDQDGNFETLLNVWVAPPYRRRGIATGMLNQLRQRTELDSLLRPFTPAGAEWIRKAAPDLVLSSAPELFSAFGRNEPCPCGSGRKFKKCCGA